MVTKAKKLLLPIETIFKELTSNILLFSSRIFVILRFSSSRILSPVIKCFISYPKNRPDTIKRIPIRIELGPKDVDGGKIILVRRDTGEKMEVQFTSYESTVVSELDNIHNDMFANAKKILDERTATLETYDEFKSELEKGMLIKAPICNNPSCEEKIKEDTGADIRVIPDDCEDVNSKCIYCDDQSKIRPLFARGY